jgi:hypothetical protein
MSRVRWKRRTESELRQSTFLRLDVIGPSREVKVGEATVQASLAADDASTGPGGESLASP